MDDLLLASARGDEDAFAQVYDSLVPAVYGLAWRVARDAACAEEITQDVFLSVWRSATRFDPLKGSAQTWILTITHRRAIDVIRSEAAAIRRERRTSTHDTPFQRKPPHHLREQEVRRFLESLTQLQRESVVLAYYGGYTYPEVSTLLKANLSTMALARKAGWKTNWLEV